MPTALFGGTFDPIHKGHLAVAQAALDAPGFSLDRIHFIPADIPPHKLQQPITPWHHRYAMVELALSDCPRFTPSRIEDPVNSQGEPNYSINTVRRFKREHGLKSEDLYFIIGIDSFRDFPQWREPQALLQECRLIVATRRPGFNESTNLILPWTSMESITLLATVAVDISSTQIRQAVANGESLDEYVPAAVAAYIDEHQLYR
jgi:nicotinate-nucleotide adenylyltransferase